MRATGRAAAGRSNGRLVAGRKRRLPAPFTSTVDDSAAVGFSSAEQKHRDHREHPLPPAPEEHPLAPFFVVLAGLLCLISRFSMIHAIGEVGAGVAPSAWRSPCVTLRVGGLSADVAGKEPRDGEGASQACGGRRKKGDRGPCWVFGKSGLPGNARQPVNCGPTQGSFGQGCGHEHGRLTKPSTKRKNRK